MRSTRQLFHLAIPCKDLDSTEAFYTEVLGCRRARRYEDRITLDFFGDQVVCHLAPDEIDEEPKLYPRHFGLTFLDKSDFDNLVESAKAKGATFLQEVSVRFPGMQEEHLTVALLDPSNNVLEFKHYNDASMVY